MDKCDICGKDMENLPYREKEGIKEGVYKEMCSKHCLEQFYSLYEEPDTSYSDWIERGTGI